jgi:hypothetical protein
MVPAEKGDIAKYEASGVEIRVSLLLMAIT